MPNMPDYIYKTHYHPPGNRPVIPDNPFDIPDWLRRASVAGKRKYVKWAHDNDFPNPFNWPEVRDWVSQNGLFNPDSYAPYIYNPEYHRLGGARMVPDTHTQFRKPEKEPYYRPTSIKKPTAWGSMKIPTGYFEKYNPRNFYAIRFQ